MKYLFIISALVLYAFTAPRSFNSDKDLLLVQLDCKTDIDDIHTAAALYALTQNKAYATLQYKIIAGTYGIQEGLYVPPNTLLNMAFKNEWIDAHADREKALKKTLVLVKKTLKKGGDIWIAEAGQSDFSALLVKSVQQNMPEFNTKERIHIVQHSDWNESVTTKADLAFVQKNTDYRKIPDGNVEGNGSPGFRRAGIRLDNYTYTHPRVKQVWEEALRVANTYNGKEGRYNNEAVAEGGLDFSDFAEVCSILGIEHLTKAEDFFQKFN
ncbi:hypothetical protein LAG90_06060 [Marinilongibacter aquaticus]|uniref:hypothetical protein n=1 Tax=Marinilongibacter aquaticus TaxID=2975157 RepID=UPI0021BD683C|nr:hypothetical protein [Marinilongibacter aquaticus]UBM60206.1 hypothetical protein LAG90_06060 [Marinilongibacter aquaticus]